MNWGHNPVPKTTYPKGKKKKLEVYKGKSIPSNKTRSAISKKVYNQVIEEHGSVCLDCGNPYIEIHHCVFRSQFGKGVYRNLIPLCKEHHMKCHKNFNYAEKWREWLRDQYGEFYWCDKYDLWKKGLIKNPTFEEYEKFMEKEELDG
jgi:hypothetical protein